MNYLEYPQAYVLVEAFFHFVLPMNGDRDYFVMGDWYRVLVVEGGLYPLEKGTWVLAEAAGVVGNYSLCLVATWSRFSGYR